MAQTTNMAPTLAQATSTDIVVAAGVSACVGIFGNATSRLGQAGEAFSCTVYQLTPGEPNPIGKLDAAAASVLVSGPGTFRVIKPASQIAIGVFSE